MLPPIPPDDLLPRFTETDWRYARAIGERGDTYLHLPTLAHLTTLVGDQAQVALWNAHVLRGGGITAERAPRADVVEFGVRAVCTTWAFLAARPRSLVCVDIADPPPMELAAARACADEEGVAFEFVRADTLELSPVSCDLLFIDTKHTYAQLSAELARHAGGVARFIAFHDTMSFGFVGDDGTKPGLQDAIEELCDGKIEGSGKWTLRWHDERCSGLAIVERVS